MCFLFLLDYNTKTEALILRTRLIHLNELNIFVLFITPINTEVSLFLCDK